MDRYDWDWNRGYAGPRPAYDRDSRYGGGGWADRGRFGGRGEEWPRGRPGADYGHAGHGWPGGPPGRGGGAIGGNYGAQYGGGYGAIYGGGYAGGYGGAYGRGYGGAGYDRSWGSGLHWPRPEGGWSGGGDYGLRSRPSYDEPPQRRWPRDPDSRYGQMPAPAYYDDPSARFSSPGRFQEFGAGAHDEYDTDFDDFEPDVAGFGGYHRGWGAEPDDAEVQRRVWESLHQDGFVDAEAIEVEVKDQVVTLRGEVADYMESRYAWDDAWDVAGVCGVISKLTIRGGDRQETPPHAATKAPSSVQEDTTSSASTDS